MNKDLNIAVVGTYKTSELYSRNIIAINTIKSICSNAREFRPDYTASLDATSSLTSFSRFIIYTYTTLRQWFSLSRQIKAIRSYPIIYVPYPAHLDILLVKIFTLGKKNIIIMDAFLGLHDTAIMDRKLFSKTSIASHLIRLLEKISLSYADMIILDTKLQADSLIKSYQLPENKVTSLPVGINESQWRPQHTLDYNENFNLLFWGTFIPLHGVEIIIESALKLQASEKNIQFTLVGTGQTAYKIKSEYKDKWPVNVKWVDKILPMNQLHKMSEEAHCILGIFGTSAKSSKVIPYKVYQALSMNKPIITRNSQAYPQQPPQSLITISPGNASELTVAILTLIKNYTKYTSSSDALHYYETHFSNKAYRKSFQIMLQSLNYE